MSIPQQYVRVPLTVFEQLADVLSQIDFLQANLTDKSTIREQVAKGHVLIERALGPNATAIYAEEK